MNNVLQKPLLFSLLFLAGCSKQTEEKNNKKPLVCNTNNISSTSLIVSSDQVVSLQDQNTHSTDFPFSLESKDVHSLFLDSKSCEARLTDIPVPLMAQVISSSSDKDGSGMLLIYKTSLAVTELVAFYEKEMEHYGWVKESMFDGDEIILSFKKPNRFCFVTLRPVKKTWIKSQQIILSLFMGNNE